jgi:general secretion pathway protein C
MQDKFLSSRMALDQRTAKLEQALDRCAQLVAQIPLRTWQFLITLLLVLWLGYSLARLFWLAIPEPTIAPAALVLVAPTSTTAVEAQSLNIEDLKGLDVFGQAQQVATTEPVTSAPIEEETVDTKLNLVLMGVIASSDEPSGRAIIAANGQQEMYAPGAELPVGKGVTLVKVMDLRVILNNNGQFESLWLYQDSDDPRRASIASNYATPEQAPSRSWTNENEPAAESDQQSPLFVDKSPASDRRGPDQSGTEDPTAEISRNISDVVAMSIHREGGRVVGYKIRPGRNAEQFKALGLEADDIVTAVNGVPLDNPGKIMEIYKNMSNATSASLEIKRGGSVLSVDVVLQ